MKIKGMIFAAGLGTRLRPLTDRIPKAMVEVGGQTMLSRTVCRLAEAGAEEIVINVHHHAPIILDYISELQRSTPVPLISSDESALLLDTGGGILKARPYLEDADAIIIHNADILCDAPLRPMVYAHMASDSLSTLLVDPHRSSSRLLLFDDANRLHGRINTATGKLTLSPLSTDISALRRAAFGGIHVASPRIFSALSRYAEPDTPFSITDFYLAAAEGYAIRAYSPDCDYIWVDIGKPESLRMAQEIAPRM